MLQRAALLSFAGLFLAACAAAGEPLAPAAGEKQALANDNNAFALELYAKLNGAGKGNLFFSPYSISTALAMTYAGARGNTAAQMEKTLHFTLGQARLPVVCGAFVQELNAAEKNGRPRGFQLSTANRLFGQKGYAFLPNFLELTKTSYGAGLEELDFKANAEASRLAINKWVEEKTQEKIKDLVPPLGVTDATRLVLANAIYFKSAWAQPFDKRFTKDEAFHLSAANEAQAPLMNKTASFNYLEEENNFQALELPYKDGELSMLIFLPAKVDGLAELEKTFTAEKLKQWPGQLARQKVNVMLPKFKVTWGTVDLKSSLNALGIKDAFDANSADFSGMTNDPQGLYISAVFHKAFVDVNEEGTEAAAATAVAMKPGAAFAPAPPKLFRADHPFLFLIRENTTGTLLFMGRVADPR